MAFAVEQYLPSVIMIVVGLFLGNEDKKRTKKADDHQRHISGMFSQLITCITANNDGMIALAQAIKKGDKNGGLTAAMEKIAKANDSFEIFIRDLAANNLGKQ